MSSKRHRWKQRYKEWADKNQFQLAGLQLLNIAKIATDTVKPYKSKSHLRRDLLQAAYGLFNILMAILHLIFIPVMLILGIIGALVDKKLSELSGALYESTGILTHAITLAIHGLIQIITTPLVWLRAIGKGIYAAVQGWQLFNNNSGVKSWMESGIQATAQATQPNPHPDKENRDTARAIEAFSEVHRKTGKALTQGQPVPCNSAEYREKFMAVTDSLDNLVKDRPGLNFVLPQESITAFNNYFNLFKNDSNSRMTLDALPKFSSCSEEMRSAISMARYITNNPRK